MQANMIDPKGWIFVYEYAKPVEVAIIGWRWDEERLFGWPITLEGKPVIAVEGPEYSIKYDLGKWELLVRG